MTAIKAGFIGLGAMGLPMAGHLAQVGLLVAVGNRTQTKAKAAAQSLGVLAPDTTGDIATSCDMIALCVSADADVLTLTAEIARRARPGTIVIDHSTVSSVTARMAGEAIRSVGGDFLDAPVSGGVEGARNGTLSIMVGGDAATLERARPLLECYGARISHMGAIGAGQNTKAVNQVLVAGIAAAVCEGLALGEALGLAADALLPTLGAGAAGCWFLDKRGASMLRNEFAVGFKLALLHKDLGIVQQLARDAGTDRSVIDKALADYATLIADGRTDEDISALIRLKRAS
ncbi:MAG: NAD(P)-dependent oxidoreductase [Rhodanobacteraceae bacterium]